MSGKKIFYEEKLPQRWEVGDKISEDDIATTNLGRVVTRSLDIDLATRSCHLNPPNTVAFIYHCDGDGVVQHVERTQVREVPLKAVALSQ